MKKTLISFKKTAGWMMIFVLALILAMTFIAPASLAAAKKTTNKALKANVSFTGISEAAMNDGSLSQEEITKAMSANSYSLATSIDGAIKLNRKMTLSAKFYIPKAMLKNQGSKINLLPLLICRCSNCPTVYQIWGKYAVVVSKDAGKVKINLYDAKSAPVKTEKTASLKKKGKYYVLTLKNYPMNAKTHEEKGITRSVKVPVSGTYHTDVLTSMTAMGSAFKGAVYVDDLKLSAKKITKISYDKKDYKKVYGFSTYSGKKITVATSAIR